MKRLLRVVVQELNPDTRRWREVASSLAVDSTDETYKIVNEADRIKHYVIRELKGDGGA